MATHVLAPASSDLALCSGEYPELDVHVDDLVRCSDGAYRRTHKLCGRCDFARSASSWGSFAMPPDIETWAWTLPETHREGNADRYFHQGALLAGCVLLLMYRPLGVCMLVSGLLWVAITTWDFLPNEALLARPPSHFLVDITLLGICAGIGFAPDALARLPLQYMQCGLRKALFYYKWCVRPSRAISSSPAAFATPGTHLAVDASSAVQHAAALSQRPSSCRLHTFEDDSPATLNTANGMLPNDGQSVPQHGVAIAAKHEIQTAVSTPSDMHQDLAAKVAGLKQHVAAKVQLLTNIGHSAQSAVVVYSRAFKSCT